MKNTIIIAHLHKAFFIKTQTFIYQYASNLKKFHPIYLAGEFINLKHFSIPDNDCYKIYFKRYSFSWLYYGVMRILFGINILAQRAIRQRSARLIHAHFGYNGVRALKIKKRLNVPLITNFYGYDVTKSARLPQWKREYPKLFKGGDLFLVEGEYMKSKLIEIGCPEEKIKIQRIAVDLEKIAFKIRQPKNNDEKVKLIFCGRFAEIKGLIYALEAMGKVRELHTNFEFRIIGDGPLKPSIERYIEEHKMSTYVKLLGFLDYNSYIKEMSEADIFIHPSVTTVDGNSEGGAPTTILEAQAAGLPIISTYHADIPNIVVPGQSALLSKERDSQELANNISILIEDQKRWSEMGKIGRAFVERHHDIKSEVDALENKYESLLSEN